MDFTITMINLFKYLLENLDILHKDMRSFGTDIEETLNGNATIDKEKKTQQTTFRNKYFL